MKRDGRIETPRNATAQRDEFSGARRNLQTGSADASAALSALRDAAKSAVELAHFDPARPIDLFTIRHTATATGKNQVSEIS
ncbi:hypothetical protein J8273_6800 [Carpediemonas membranifera]|uniref:Uncharacterized protein n=1 Tax=Carpediemonas membranifera TaxID=201153 RepID=A0A8J6BVZ4_9EUKA|nr:hypothetical protein J8273_6800 [Carpediemonas membranifera]|eukprot:KAG9391911.1 hypothetical protein J8273_6800 [Carpediemonas membranifera]